MTNPSFSIDSQAFCILASFARLLLVVILGLTWTQDKLLQRLAKLEPQVTNYNPSDLEQLTKAADQVVADQGGSASAE